MLCILRCGCHPNPTRLCPFIHWDPFLQLKKRQVEHLYLPRKTSTRLGPLTIDKASAEAFPSNLPFLFIRRWNPKFCSNFFFLSHLQVVQTWQQGCPFTGRARAAQGNDWGLGRHGDLRGLQEVHHRNHLIQQAQPVHSKQACASQPENPVLLHVAVSLRQLYAIRAHHQRSVGSAIL